MEEIKKEKIYAESIIAGALLKFESLDMIDVSLLVEDYETKTNTEIIDLWHYFPNHIDTYITILRNGIHKLRDGISLDDFIEEENRTLKDKLLEVAGNTVNHYFISFEAETFKQKKEKALLENKDKLLNTANILLISDIQDDYDELVKYGFKKIDYFKSIIRADQYFAKHPEELEKYHIILKGNQNVQHCCFDGDVELDRKIGKLSAEKQILEAALNRYDYPDHIEFITYLNDNITHSSYSPRERTYTDLFDRIVENTFINHTLEKVELKDKKFVPIQDYINPNRFLPTKKSDLKILYLGSIWDSDIWDRIAKELGVNIDCKEENNCSLGRYVKSNLGKYDIMIVTNTYSGNLLSMNRESTEQCKDTGRELTLLVTRQDNSWGIDKDLACRFALNYVFGGNYAPDSEYHNKEIRILHQPNELVAYSEMKGIIEASVNFYNQALIKMGKLPISDLDFKTAEEFNQDYVSAYEKKEAILEAELAPIRLFDDTILPIFIYLSYRKSGLINKEPEGLKITEGTNGIRVENLYQGRTLCAITFPKNNKQEDLRIFEIQTLSNKGNLSNPQTIGIYTSKYENLESIPNRPDKKQEDALASIRKKINVVLKPLNEEALEKKHRKQETEKQKTLTLKRKNKKRRKY